VREYASTDAPEATREQLSKQLIPLYWLRMPRTLPASAGMHRWVWDLRYASPTATRYEYPISAVLHDTPRIPQGPLALPGTYKIRLIANGKAITVPLEIKMDPRVDSMQADLEELLALESRLAGMVSNSSEASLEAHSIREQIQKLSEKQQPQQLEDSRHKLDQGLTALLSGGANSGEKEPGLDELTEEVASLYTQVGQADAAPTAAQQQAASHTGEELSGVLQSWSRWKASSIPELNRQLRAAREPELDFERKPQTMPEAGDVE
jgi:hypothetical protein